MVIDYPDIATPYWLTTPPPSDTHTNLANDMAMEVRKCFMCDENPRLDGDFLCRSCKEEHPMCYECGSRKRNFPFKFCEKCYLERRSQDAGPPGALSVLATASTSSVSGPGANGNDGANGHGTDGANGHVTDGGSDGGTSEIMNLLTIESDSDDDDSSLDKLKVLHSLQDDQNTYKEIAKHFQKEWVKLTDTVKSPPHPVAIFAIQNRRTQKKFKKYGHGIRQKSRVSNSDLFFHGTSLLCNIINSKVCCEDSNCGICGISLEGFDEDKIGTNIPRFQRFGSGIYLAPNSSKCHDYTQGNPKYGLRAQLLCLVAQGARHELLQNSTKLKEAPEGFDCVYGKKGGSLNYDEVVVYDADAVWPQYVVVYELNGVGKIAK